MGKALSTCHTGFTKLFLFFNVNQQNNKIYKQCVDQPVCLIFFFVCVVLASHRHQERTNFLEDALDTQVCILKKLNNLNFLCQCTPGCNTGHCSLKAHCSLKLTRPPKRIRLCVRTREMGLEDWSLQYLLICLFVILDCLIIKQTLEL